MEILDTIASRHLGEMREIPSWTGYAPKWPNKIRLENARYADLLERGAREIRLRGKVLVNDKIVIKELSFLDIVNKDGFRFAKMVDVADGQHYLLDPFYVLVAFEIIDKSN